MNNPQPNPYQSPEGAGSEPPHAKPVYHRRHHSVSIAGWVLVAIGLPITGSFVFLTVTLFYMHQYQPWMGTLAIWSFLLAFGLLSAVMFLFVNKTAPKVNLWANVLPSVLWALALVFASEVAFFAVCTMMS